MTAKRTSGEESRTSSTLAKTTTTATLAAPRQAMADRSRHTVIPRPSSTFWRGPSLATRSTRSSFCTLLESWQCGKGKYSSSLPRWSPKETGSGSLYSESSKMAPRSHVLSRGTTSTWANCSRRRFKCTHRYSTFQRRCFKHKRRNGPRMLGVRTHSRIEKSKGLTAKPPLRGMKIWSET